MNAVAIKRDKGKIWSHVRSRWLVETPEETVRQEYLLVLINKYGFVLDQNSEEMSAWLEGDLAALAWRADAQPDVAGHRVREWSIGNLERPLPIWTVTRQPT
jgi:hypothetical protein